MLENKIMFGWMYMDDWLMYRWIFVDGWIFLWMNDIF
jgi:hypothetical protein